MIKNSHFMALVITAHVGFIVAHIYRHTQFITQSFRHQKNERTQQHLEHKKQTLGAQLYAMKDPNYIKRYAQEHLHMQPIALAQVKKMTPHDAPDR